VLLVISACTDRQWGFLMLEGAWMLVTGYAIAGSNRRAATPNIDALTERGRHLGDGPPLLWR
jgi:hypothetical protein